MMNITYFKVNRAHLDQVEVVAVINELAPLPPSGSRITISTDDGSLDAEVISTNIDIVSRGHVSLYEQTIYCNGRW